MRTVTEADDRADVTMPRGLYQRLLGPAAGRLDDRVADLHCNRGDVVAAGRLHVRRGSDLLARIAAAALRLPPSGERVPTRLLIARRSSGEHWIRVFGDSPPVCSWQHASADGWLLERFGPLQLTFELEADAGALHFHQRDCRLVVAGLDMPIPDGLTPRVDATVEPTSTTEQVSVRVQITAPVTGCLLTYTGAISIEKGRP